MRVAAGFLVFVVGFMLVIDGVLHATDTRRLSAAAGRGLVRTVLVPGAFVIAVGVTLVVLGLALGGFIEPDPPGWLKP